MRLRTSSDSSRLVFTAVLLVTVSACGSDPSDPCETVTPTVNLSGPAPVFDWTSTCPLGSLDVAPSDSAGAFTWFVLANPGQNTIRPPATYGAPVEGAAIASPVTDSLVSGRQYRVRLSRTTGPAGFGYAVVGQAEFTVP